MNCDFSRDLKIINVYSIHFICSGLKINVEIFACALQKVKKKIYIFFLKNNRRNPYNFRAIFHKNIFFLAEQTFNF